MLTRAIYSGKHAVQNFLRSYGYELVRTSQPSRPETALNTGLPVDFDPETTDTVRSVQGYTMTGPEKIFALTSAVKYIVRCGVPGAVVECGVWKGGSMMAAARTLLHERDTSRHLYLFDTFEGMTKPTELDVDFKGVSALQEWQENKYGTPFNAPARAAIEDVRKAIDGVGYGKQNVHFVKGKVEDTVPTHAPEQIALLRLDTDWYESTRHALVELYPRLAPGGVLIVDDYGHFAGAKQAVDEYIAQNNVKILLNRIDYSGRLAVKPWV